MNCVGANQAGNSNFRAEDTTMEAMMSPIKTKSDKRQALSAQAFLDSADIQRRVQKFEESQEVFTQGDPATSVMYIQEGRIKLSVVNEAGKEAIVGILGPGDFFGEGCLADQPVRTGTATALLPTTVSVIQKNEMVRAIHSERALPDRFMSYLLSRTLRTQEDLIDQLFNTSEKRLARALLLLTGYGKQEVPQMMLPKISQEMLAEMVGTTRPRVSVFMNKFKKMGFIEYEGGLQIKPSLLNVLLQE
jgi:CRP/FNR family cyclic AMP-dependent transcriptional regulator